MKTLSKDTISIYNNNKLNTQERERDCYTENQPKKYNKVIYEEELDSEPEVEGNDYVTEETEEEPEKAKPKKVQQKWNNNVFEHINNNTKRNK